MCRIAYLEIVAPHPGVNSVKLLKDMLETVGPEGEVHLFLPIKELLPQNELEYISLHRIPKVAYNFIMHQIINLSLSSENIEKKIVDISTLVAYYAILLSLNPRDFRITFTLYPSKHAPRESAHFANIAYSKYQEPKLNDGVLKIIFYRKRYF